MTDALVTVPSELEVKREQKYRVEMSERMSDIMRDPRWTEGEREKLVGQIIRLTGTQPVGEVLTDQERADKLTAEIEKQYMRLVATEAANQQ